MLTDSYAAVMQKYGFAYNYFPIINENANCTVLVHHCFQFIADNMDISTANTGDQVICVADVFTLL